MTRFLLTPEQIAQVREWRRQVDALGTRGEWMAKAEAEWQALRNAIPRVKEMAAILNVNESTLQNYYIASSCHRRKRR